MARDQAKPPVSFGLSKGEVYRLVEEAGFPLGRAQVMTPKELALSVVRELRGQGHTAYWAGGCVRDRLFGPRSRWTTTLRTDARPEQIQSYFPGSLAIGAKFGVVLVREGEARVEVATFRREGEYHDGRRPCDVRFTDNAEQDAGRRDFTVNGLFFDPIEERCLDYVGRSRRPLGQAHPGYRRS